MILEHTLALIGFWILVGVIAYKIVKPLIVK